jgi:hypothetical protein
MRKTFTILLLLWFPSDVCFSQTTNCRTDTIYRYSLDKYTLKKTLKGRTIFSYHENGKITEELNQNWYEDIGWRNSAKWTYAYNEVDSLIEKHRSLWNSMNNFWRIWERELWTYDNNNHPKTQTSENRRNANDSLEFEYKNFYKYAVDGKILEWITQRWSFNSIDSIYRQFKSNYTYDNSGNLIKLHGTEFHKIKQTWTDLSLLNYTFFDGKMIESVSKDWDYYLDTWSLNRKTIYVYDSEGRITQTLSWRGTPVKGDSIYSDLSLLGYDEMGNLIEGYTFGYNAQAKAWNNKGRRFLFYDINNKITKEHHQSWDMALSKWKHKSMTDWEYDNNENLISQVIWANYDDKWVKSYIRNYEYDRHGNLAAEVYFNWWELANSAFSSIDRREFKFTCEQDTNYSYIPTFPNIPDILSIYPNPVLSGNSLHIVSNSNTSFVLYDMMGKNVMQGELKSGDNSIENHGLRQGVYILKLPKEAYRILIE